MVIKDYGQIPALIQPGQQRRNPAGKIGENEDLSLLPVYFFQDCRIRFLQAGSFYTIPLSLKSSGQYGAGTESVGIVMVIYIDPLLRSGIDFFYSLLRSLDELPIHTAFSLLRFSNCKNKGSCFKNILPLSDQF